MASVTIRILICCLFLVFRGPEELSCALCPANHWNSLRDEERTQPLVFACISTPFVWCADVGFLSFASGPLIKGCDFHGIYPNNFPNHYSPSPRWTIPLPCTYWFGVFHAPRGHQPSWPPQFSTSEDARSWICQRRSGKYFPPPLVRG